MAARINRQYSVQSPVYSGQSPVASPNPISQLSSPTLPSPPPFPPSPELWPRRPDFDSDDSSSEGLPLQPRALDFGNEPIESEPDVDLMRAADDRRPPAAAQPAPVVNPLTVRLPSDEAEANIRRVQQELGLENIEQGEVSPPWGPYTPPSASPPSSPGPHTPPSASPPSSPPRVQRPTRENTGGTKRNKKKSSKQRVKAKANSTRRKRKRSTRKKY